MWSTLCVVILCSVQVMLRNSNKLLHTSLFVICGTFPVICSCSFATSNFNFFKDLINPMRTLEHCLHQLLFENIHSLIKIYGDMGYSVSITSPLITFPEISGALPCQHSSGSLLISTSFLHVLCILFLEIFSSRLNLWAHSEGIKFDYTILNPQVFM